MARSVWSQHTTIIIKIIHINEMVYIFNNFDTYFPRFHESYSDISSIYISRIHDMTRVLHKNVVASQINL
jgi:hypothetical protein